MKNEDVNKIIDTLTSLKSRIYIANNKLIKLNAINAKEMSVTGLVSTYRTEISKPPNHPIDDKFGFEEKFLKRILPIYDDLLEEYKKEVKDEIDHDLSTINKILNINK